MKLYLVETPKVKNRCTTKIILNFYLSQKEFCKYDMHVIDI